ncbi:MAG TPA: hypothetical protein VLF93_01520 [Candidatus Saccharimonadales bacterium]|nr:hypothetical protein [Candidatus Saccharimonadales bacterium]
MGRLAEIPLGIGAPEADLPFKSGFKVNHQMNPFSSYAIDLDAPIPKMPGSKIGRATIHGPIVGGITVADENFYLIDTRFDPRAPYLMLTSGRYNAIYDPRRKPEYLNLEAGRLRAVGRNPDASEKIFSHTDHMARHAFGIMYDGQSTVTVTNDEPTNPTLLTGHLTELDAGYSQRDSGIIVPNLVLPDIREGYTEGAQYVHGDGRVDLERTPYGYLEGTDYAIIGRNSPTVKGGVYLTSGYLKSNHEAILVDDWAPELQESQEKIVKRVAERFRAEGNVSVRDILIEVRNASRNSMRYDKDEVERLIEQLYGEDGIVPLSAFRRAGIATCRYHNVDAALQMEALIEAGYLNGRSVVERKIDETHAWAIFFEKSNYDPRYAWVVDPSSRLDSLRTRYEHAQLGNTMYSFPGEY